MSCPFEIDVVRWVTGDTRLNELPRVEQHVSECASCRSKAESLRSILNRIAEPAAQGETNESSPKVFVDSVMEKIGREGAPRAGARPTRRFLDGSPHRHVERRSSRSRGVRPIRRDVGKQWLGHTRQPARARRRDAASAGRRRSVE